MRKEGLKTFVYSFTFSLFTLFAVNGAYFRVHSSKTPHTKISNKNITLFLKEATNNPQNLPTKKIELAILNDIKASQKEESFLLASNADIFIENSNVSEPEIIEKETIAEHKEINESKQIGRAHV